MPCEDTHRNYVCPWHPVKLTPRNRKDLQFMEDLEFVPYELLMTLRHYEFTHLDAEFFVIKMKEWKTFKAQFANIKAKQNLEGLKGKK